MFLLALCGGGRPSASLPLLADVPASPRRGASHPVRRRSQITNRNTIEGALALDAVLTYILLVNHDI